MSYYYIEVSTEESFDIPIGIINTFNNLLEYLNYQFFITGIKRLQRINVTISVKSNNYFIPFDYIYVT